MREIRMLCLTRRELETWPRWNCDPTTQSKECGWKPSTYRTRASSRPYEETEREWANPPASSVIRPALPLNGRSERAKRRESSPNASSDNLDGSLRLSSGERRILTALAQYPQGRSKVQVAVLTGYALNGGGFNNYLGALRTRGFVRCDGDRLTITEAGMEALSSWEPLPTGPALIDYWRGRAGKSRTAHSGNTHQGVSQCTHQRRSGCRGRIRSEWGRFQQRLGPAEDS